MKVVTTGRFDQFEYMCKQHNRAVWGSLVPEITFVLYLCGATRIRVGIEEVAAQAVSTYPEDFFTPIDGKKIPDLSLVLLALKAGKQRQWGYISGNWFRGWRLTRKGIKFSRDVERRKAQLWRCGG